MAAPAYPFRESSGELISERLHEVGERRSFARPDMHRGRHAGDKLHGAKSLGLVLGKQDSRHEVHPIELRLSCQIGSHALHFASKLGCRALIECREAYNRGLFGSDLIDVLRSNARFYRRGLPLGHDEHDRLARGDDAAQRMRNRGREELPVRTAVLTAIANHRAGEAPVIIGNSMQLVGIDAISEIRASGDFLPE